MSSFANVSSRWSITRPLTLLGASGLKIVGRPRVEMANPFWHRLCNTLYADVRGIFAVSAMTSALPYPWATRAMYPRASYPERPIDSRVFVARSNSWSRSIPSARSFVRSCGTTMVHIPRSALYLFEAVASAPLSNGEPTFGCDGKRAARAARTHPRPLPLLDRRADEGRAGSRGPALRLDRLRAVRDFRAARRRARHLESYRGEGRGVPDADRPSLRRIPDDPARVPVRERPHERERGRSPRRGRRRLVHGPPRDAARGEWPRNPGPIPDAVSVRPPKQSRGPR